MSTSSEDFAVRVNCHSNFCEDEAVGLQLEIRNEFETDNKTNFTCATKAPVFTHNRKVCAVADNITLTFDISVHITSFESETLTKICLLDRQNYSMKLSECPSGKISMTSSTVIMTLLCSA